MTTITQADRDRAQGWLDCWTCDDLAELFAAHREAAEARARLEGAKAMRGAAEALAYAEAAKHEGPQSVGGTPAMLWDQALRLASSIAALDPAQIAGGKP